jgi:hypothetical protein
MDSFKKDALDRSMSSHLMLRKISEIPSERKLKTGSAQTETGKRSSSIRNYVAELVDSREFEPENAKEVQRHSRIPLHSKSTKDITDITQTATTKDADWAMGMRTACLNALVVSPL